MTTLKEFSVGALTIHMAKSRIAMDRRAAAEIARKYGRVSSNPMCAWSSLPR
jgi:hypothetical protein